MTRSHAVRRNAIAAPAPRVPWHARSLLKSLTWRATATVDTFVISWLVTGSISWASSIVGVEVVTKLLIYYAHERVWAAVSWGRE